MPPDETRVEPPLALLAELTHRCPLRCPYCSNPLKLERATDELTEAEWRRQLTDEQYHVTRKAGTERALSSEMCSLFEPGLYSCVCCDTLLFDSNEKFESHTGWPSFTQPVEAGVIAVWSKNSILQRTNTCPYQIFRCTKNQGLGRRSCDIVTGVIERAREYGSDVPDTTR